jgi:hypothetical protein
MVYSWYYHENGGWCGDADEFLLSNSTEMYESCVSCIDYIFSLLTVTQ